MCDLSFNVCAETSQCHFHSRSRTRNPCGSPRAPAPAPRIGYIGSGIVKRSVAADQLRSYLSPDLPVCLFSKPEALLRAGVSTLAIALGCCGFFGPVPSATLDKRCLFGSTEILTKGPRRGQQPSLPGRHPRRCARPVVIRDALSETARPSSRFSGGHCLQRPWSHQPIALASAA
jgi:hypothetical protein